MLLLLQLAELPMVVVTGKLNRFPSASFKEYVPLGDNAFFFLSDFVVVVVVMVVVAALARR